MSRHGKLERLQVMPSLSEVSDEAIDWLACHVTEVHISAGHQFITEGDHRRECYFIVSGQTRVTRSGLELGITGPGEPEGEVALFLGIRRTATTTATTDVTALRLDAADFDALRATDARLADSLRVGICRHLARRFGLTSFAGISSDNRPARGPIGTKST